MPDESGPPGTIQSGTHLLEIVDVLQEHDGLGVTALAEEVGRSKGSVHRYLKTLAAHGYVVKRDGVYELGLRFLDHGVYVQRRREVYLAATPKVEALAEEVGERAWCIVEEDDLGVFLCGAVGENAVKTDARVGYRNALHCTSGGKAILAHLPEHRVEEIVDRRGLSRKTPNTITTVAELDAELDTVREQGYAVNLEESVDGLHAVGAPVYDGDGTLRGSVSVAGASRRLDEGRCHGDVSEAVLAAANEVELELTYA